MHKNRHRYFGQQSLEKPNVGKSVQQERILLFSISSVQLGAKLAYPTERKFSSTSPSLSVNLADLCIALRPSMLALPLCINTGPLYVTHAGPPMTAQSATSASASPTSTLIFWCCSQLSVPYLLPPAALQTTSLNFSANPAPEMKLTGLPQCVLQLTLKPLLILFSLIRQRPRLNF